MVPRSQCFTSILAVAPRLLPFLITAVSYFVLALPKDQPSVLAVIVKCTPIYCLIYFVLKAGVSTNKNKLALALVFSSIGDAFLVWKEFFPHGMAAFGVAQVIYFTTFGFKPLKPVLGAIWYLVGTALVALVFSNLKGILLYGLPIYAVLLVTMLWRATARHSFDDKGCDKWLRLSGSIGAILFVISDGLIALSQFYMHIPNAQTYIMSTYYAGQLGLSMTCLEDGAQDKRSSVRKSTKRS
ncbi:lysoplasmalogenase-like protein TMEM86A [Ctenocephalides felis]|uniref:lysoplasmalogenase-like protein TMEM86A n=1 Tax=Ctenocephalides felis TaxID=7515 RepID=UPI000E6E1A32|nr:lysoplasmalogenase-like protein TMEM86A [Ctenocephalides felis]